MDEQLAPLCGYYSHLAERVYTDADGRVVDAALATHVHERYQYADGSLSHTAVRKLDVKASKLKR